MPYPNKVCLPKLILHAHEQVQGLNLEMLVGALAQAGYYRLLFFFYDACGCTGAVGLMQVKLQSEFGDACGAVLIW
eukprot:1158166-Pelagomonas_calceolata.AAC.11